MLFQGVNHIAVYVKNREESIAFYQNVIGAKLLFTVDNESDGLLIAMLRLGNMNLELLEPTEKKEEVVNAAKKTQNHVALEVADAQEAVDFIKANGYEVEEPGIYDVPNFGSSIRHLKVAFFHGPNGERIEIFQETIEED